MDELSEQRAFELGNKVAAAAASVGLYPAGPIGITQTPDGRHALVVGFLVGDIAWADRVQHPERAETETPMRILEQQAAVDEFMEIREGLLKRLEDGEFNDE